MVLTLLVSLAAPLQGIPASVPPAAAPALPPVALWLSDTSLDPGARARVFVRLRQPGHLVVLRVDGDGKISVVFPRSPRDDARLPGGATYEIPGPDGRASFAVTEPAGVGTVLAARTATPLSIATLAAGDAWDYSALLFQPTAGDARAALLDIADRLTGGRPFDYDLATYTVTAPPVVAQAASVDGPAAIPIYARGEAPAYAAPAAPPYAPPAAVAPLPTVSADCSNAFITNGSACASVVYNNAAPEQAPPVTAGREYYPYYNPYLYYPRWYFSHPRVARDTVKMAPPEQTLALPLRPRAVRVPIPPRPRAGGQVVTLSMPRVLRSQRAPDPTPTPAASTPIVRMVSPAEPAAARAAPALIPPVRRIVMPAFAFPRALSGGATSPGIATAAPAAPAASVAPAAAPVGGTIALPRVMMRRNRP